MHSALETCNLLAEHPESYRHGEGLETSQAVNVFDFECRNHVGDGCMRNLYAVKDSNALELVEIIGLAFFLLGSPPRSCTKPAAVFHPEEKGGFKTKPKEVLKVILQRARVSCTDNLVAERKGIEEARSGGFCGGL